MKTIICFLSDSTTFISLIDIKDIVINGNKVNFEQITVKYA